VGCKKIKFCSRIFIHVNLTRVKNAQDISTFSALPEPG